MSSISLRSFPGLPHRHAGWELATATFRLDCIASSASCTVRSLYLSYERGSEDDSSIESREIRISDHPMQGGRDCSDPDDIILPIPYCYEPDETPRWYVSPYGDPARSPEEVAERVREILELDAI